MRFNRFIVCAALISAFVSYNAYAAETDNITPTNGENSAYSIVNEQDSSNTGISIITNVEYDDTTGEIKNTTTKYLNINKTTYIKDGIQGNLEYGWDSENNKLNVLPADLSIKPTVEYNGDYVGNQAGLNFINRIPAGGALYINNDEIENVPSIVGDFIAIMQLKQKIPGL